ncbi:MAG: signal peptidase I [Christensenella sp.]
MNNKENHNNARRISPTTKSNGYGRRLDPTEYENDSDALSSGTGRNAVNGHKNGDRLLEPLSAHFDVSNDDEHYEDDSYDEAYDTYDDEPKQYKHSASSGKAPRRSAREFEPLDDDLVTYNEFGHKRKQKRLKEEKLVTRSRVIWGWIISIAAAIAIAFFVRAFLFEIIVVEGESMHPTLQTNEKLAIEKVSRYFGMPERGNIIIVHYPDMDGTYVKRVIALPGETVEVKDSIVYINSEPLAEPYINNTEAYIDMSAITVPADTVFVMGDNRAHSLDSRTNTVGPIARSQIVGHALSVIWPLDNFHTVQ